MLRKFCLGNNLGKNIKENTDFFQQKPQYFPNAEVNFEGCSYAGTALWLKLFNVFLHFKHDIDLPTKIIFLFVSYRLCFYGPSRHFQLTCEWTEKRTSVHFFSKSNLLFKRERFKNSLLNYSATFFSTDIYCIANFDRICL